MTSYPCFCTKRLTSWRTLMTYCVPFPNTHLHSLPYMVIGLYRDVWIAAIASSRTRLATLTGAMCKTSQCELRSLRVNSGILNVIRIVTYYTLPPLETSDQGRSTPIFRPVTFLSNFDVILAPFRWRRMVLSMC